MLDPEVPSESQTLDVKTQVRSGMPSSAGYLEASHRPQGEQERRGRERRPEQRERHAAERRERPRTGDPGGLLERRVAVSDRCCDEQERERDQA